jgi:hypothetical protein
LFRLLTGVLHQRFQRRLCGNRIAIAFQRAGENVGNGLLGDSPAVDRQRVDNCLQRVGIERLDLIGPARTG